MPRSFLVKSGSCKTSYQKLRDLYTDTAAESVKAVAPHTPVVTDNAYNHQDYVRDDVSHPTFFSKQPSFDDSAARVTDSPYATEPTEGLQSRSPDVTMQPRGLSHAFSPRDYPPKKRPRDPSYDVSPPTSDRYYGDVKRSRVDYHDNEAVVPLKDYASVGSTVRFDDYETRKRYEPTTTPDSEYENSPKLDSRDYLRNISMSAGNDAERNAYKFCYDFNSNVVPQSPPFCQSTENDENQNLDAYRQRTSNTVDYTLDAFLVSDGRSKRKQNAQPTDKTEKQRYTCNECGKHYATSSNLSRHKQTHRSLESKLAKKCPHCDKVYVSMPALSMHVLTHELRHTCHVCNKAFSRPWLLQGHLRSHTGERPFGCAHCGKAFADRSNLRAHMQTHSTLKNFSCERCNKTFALKSYLNKHYESACVKDEHEIENEMNNCGDIYTKEV